MIDESWWKSNEENEEKHKERLERLRQPKALENRTPEGNPITKDEQFRLKPVVS